MTTHWDRRTLLAVAITIIFWASAFAGIKAALSAYTPGHLVLLRFGIASLIFLVYAVATRMRLPSRRDIPGLALVGFVDITLYQICLNIGEQSVSAGASSFIIAIVPIGTALLATRFLKERLNRIGWIGVALSFVGVAIISAGQGQGLQFTPGALWVVVAAIAESFGFVAMKPYLRRYTGLEMSAYIIWAATLFMLVFAPGLPQQIAAAPLSATLAIVYLGIFPAALAQITWSYALSRASATRVTSALNILPIFSLIIAWFWLGEVPTVLVIAGGTLALGGVIILNTRGKDNSTTTVIVD